MRVSENTLKWIMRLYPPLLFQRIWVKRFYSGFRGVHVRIIKSIFNKNYNGSVFGGTIFSAADPFYPVLFHRLLDTGDRKLKIWSKSSNISFIKPALTNLWFDIILTDADIELAIKTLNTVGKYEHCFVIEIFNESNEVCASLINEVYIRDLNYKQTAIL